MDVHIAHRGKASAATGADSRYRLVERLLPWSGPAFALLTFAGYLAIDEFPDAETPVGQLVGYYAVHHAQIGRGGWMIAYGAGFLAFFGAVLWSRVRASTAHPALAAAVLLGVAVTVGGQVSGASAYINLGGIGDLSTISPAALQAWHIAGASGDVDMGARVLLLALGLAGLLAGAVPRWVAGTSLVLFVLYLTPVSFFASLLFLLWALVVGIALAVRPAPAAEYEAPTSPDPVPQH